MTQFYRAFEDEHRGSREAIKQRLQVYLPFISPLLELYPGGRSLDVGCGRGEWLETLLEHGLDAMGVDLDEGMLDACKARQLPAEKAEALSFLRGLPNDSLVILSGFHIVEHIPFDDLKALVFEAHRVLKPGGLLILETPNAENLVVGTQNFYLDPTHQRPIPHLLLEFLVKFCGFWRSKLLRLQENPVLLQSQTLTLMDVIGGTSPDYAIIAQKDPGELDCSSFNTAFDVSYGLSMAELAHRYEMAQEAKNTERQQQIDSIHQTLADNAQEQRKQWQDQYSALNARIESVTQQQSAIQNQINSVQTAVLELKLDELTLANAALQRSLDDAHKSAHHWYTEAEARQQHVLALRDSVAYKDQAITNLTEHVFQLKSSTSWRVTAPMRHGVSIIKVIAVSPKKATKGIIKGSLKKLMKRPRLIRIAKKILHRFPALHAYARKLATRINAEAVYAPYPVQLNESAAVTVADLGNTPAPPANLTENAKAIYQRLNNNAYTKDSN